MRARRRLASGDAHEITHLAEALVTAERQHEEFADKAPIDEGDRRHEISECE